MKMQALTQDDLDGIKNAQALAYRCVVAMESFLRPGITEKKMATHMRAFMLDHGVERYFHGPFVWFGDRTMLNKNWTDEEFLPGFKTLESGMPVILDIAPIVDGYAADIGYATTCGSNTIFEELILALKELRDLIPRRVNQGVAMDEIYAEIDRWILHKGYQICHHHYPAGVIGHLVDFVRSPDTQKFDDSAEDQGFGQSAVHFLLDQKHKARSDEQLSPYWNASPKSHHRPQSGVWAVEPHFGRGGVGVKFEEMLVVTPETAYWLDDKVPHVLRWNSHPYRQHHIIEVPECR